MSPLMQVIVLVIASWIIVIFAPPLSLDVIMSFFTFLLFFLFNNHKILMMILFGYKLWHLSDSKNLITTLPFEVYFGTILEDI